MLRSVGGKYGPENGSARFKGCYRRRIGKSPMMGRGTVSGDHFGIAGNTPTILFGFRVDSRQSSVCE